ncbi:MAG TPA: hypothetical protein VIP11_10020, partial [Gemmatimonadaceae bacterium]
AQSGPTRLYELGVEENATRAVTPDGLDVSGASWVMSPDGSMIAVSSEKQLDLFLVAGGDARHVPGALPSWRVVGWIERGLLVSEDPMAGGVVFSVDPATGRREAWADIKPRDPAGIMNLNLNTLVTTPDGRGYGYSWHRAMSDLYLVEGWA